MSKRDQTGKRRKPNRFGLLLRAIIGLYTVLMGVLVFAVAGTPAYLLMHWAWPALAVSNLVATAALRSGLVFLTYATFGMSMLIGIVVVSRVCRLRATAGEYTMSDPRLFVYFNYNLLIMAARLFFLPIVRFSAVQQWFYKGLGARLGRHVVINTVHVYDLNLLTIGDHAILGGSCKVMAHAGAGNRLVIEPVTIGAWSTIGEGAVVMPGCRIGERVVVGANSVVPRGSTLPDGTRWEGVPVRQVDGGAA